MLAWLAALLYSALLCVVFEREMATIGEYHLERAEWQQRFPDELLERFRSVGDSQADELYRRLFAEGNDAVHNQKVDIVDEIYRRAEAELQDPDATERPFAAFVQYALWLARPSALARRAASIAHAPITHSLIGDRSSVARRSPASRVVAHTREQELGATRVVADGSRREGSTSLRCRRHAGGVCAHVGVARAQLRRLVWLAGADRDRPVRARCSLALVHHHHHRHDDDGATMSDGWFCRLDMAAHAAMHSSVVGRVGRVHERCWSRVRSLKDDVVRRIFETSNFLLHIMSPGGLEPQAPGWREVLHVRFVRLASYRLLWLPSRTACTYGLVVGVCTSCIVPCATTCSRGPRAGTSRPWECRSISRILLARWFVCIA